MYAASLHQKARQKELDAVASRLANMEDSISHMDPKTPVLDAGLYERLVSMEGLFAALSDSSQCGSEPKADVHSSAARDEPEWLFSVPHRLQTIENSMASLATSS